MTNERSLIERLAVSGTEYPYRPLQEVLDVAERLEIHNLELWIPHNFGFNELSGVENQLSKRGLKAAVISTWTQLNLPGDVQPRQELIRQSMEAATALGAQYVNTYFGANPARTPEQSVKAYREAILPLTDLAERKGIIITLENEFEPSGLDLTRRAEEMLRIIEAVQSPSFKVNFDPCNFYFAGEEPHPHAYELLKNHIGYIHLKDGRVYNPRLSPPPAEAFLWKDLSGEYVCCPVGKGAINYAALLREIAGSGFMGYLGLEPHVHPEQLLTTFRESLQFIRQSLQRIE
ncbi:MAG: sugar phosphate isomerase/epimerase [Bacteroidetes bacterium]|nr:sugar phosphate isomerase/epimerase [Bacteroidota bacterium]